MLFTSTPFRRTRIAAATATLALFAAGCTSTGASDGSSTPPVDSISSATSSAASTGQTSPTTSGPASSGQASSGQLNSSPTTAQPSSGTVFETGTGTASAPAAPVRHPPIGIMTALKRAPAPVWTLTYRQLVPRAPKDTSGSSVDLILTAPALSIDLVLAHPPSGGDSLLAGVDAATGKVRWRYPTPLSHCDGTISGTAALCSTDKTTDLINMADGKTLQRFAANVGIGQTDNAVIALVPGAGYPAIGQSKAPQQPDVSAAASSLASAEAKLSSVIAATTAPGAAGPSGVAPTTGASATGSSSAVAAKDTKATLTSYTADGTRSWSANVQVAVNSYPLPKYPGYTETDPPGVFVTEQLVAVSNSAQWTALKSADGQPADVTLPDTFGGQIDSAGRVAFTDEPEGSARAGGPPVGLTTYWNAGGQRLVQHQGRIVDVPVFDIVPPLYLFQQKVGGQDGLVAVRADGSTAWTSPNDTAAAFCNGVYLLRQHDGNVVTAVDVTGKKKWSVTVPGGKDAGPPSLTCAPGQVISAAHNPLVDTGTLAVLNASNGRTLFTTKTISSPLLEPASGQLFISGQDQSTSKDVESVLVRYR